MAAYVEMMTLTLSYPLRLMAAFLSVWILKLFGYAVEAERTMISIPGRHDLAITDACSGIDQLAGLIVVSAVFAFMMQRRWGWRIFHFCMFLPAVIAANVIRLVLTVVLFDRYGEVILADAWHHGLGWFQTVLVVLFIWGLGKLIRLATAEPAE